MLLCSRIAWAILKLRFRLQRGGAHRVGFRVLTFDRPGGAIDQSFHKGVQIARMMLNQHVVLLPIDQRAANQLSVFDCWYDRILCGQESCNECDLVIVLRCTYSPSTAHDPAHFSVQFSAYYSNGAKLKMKDMLIAAPTTAEAIAYILAIEVADLVLRAAYPPPPRPAFPYDPAVWPFPDSNG